MPRTCTLVTAALLGVLASFQSCLAAGAPWGAYAYGGHHTGALPVGLRVVSLVIAVVCAVLSAMLSPGVVPAPVRQRVMVVTATLMGFGTLGCLATGSTTDMVLWAPVCATACAAAIRAHHQVAKLRDRRRFDGGSVTA